MSDHRHLETIRDNKIIYKFHPSMDKFDQKNQHRATTAATVAVVAAVVVQIVVSCSNTGRARGAAWEPPELRIDPQFSGE